MISRFVANSEKCRKYTFLGGSAQIITILHRVGYRNLLQYYMGGGLPDLLQYYNGGGGSLGTPNLYYAIYWRPLICLKRFFESLCLFIWEKNSRQWKELPEISRWVNYRIFGAFSDFQQSQKMRIHTLVSQEIFLCQINFWSAITLGSPWYKDINNDYHWCQTQNCPYSNMSENQIID